MQASRRTLLCLLLVLAACQPPQPPSVRLAARSNIPPGTGKFDYYLLNLSWSPEFCFDKAGNPECAGHYGFIVHGLWPQFRNGGYPEHCGQQPGLTNPSRMLDIMPDLHLIAHEWETHGTCTGLAPDDYFALIRNIYNSIAIPSEFVGTRRQFNATPGEIKRSFEQRNPGLTDAGIALTCRGPYLTAVEICIGKDGKPVPGSGLRDCHLPTLRVPRIR